MMLSFLIVFLGLFLLSMLMYGRGAEKDISNRVDGRIFYCVFVILAALSPVVGGAVAGLLGLGVGISGALSFMWLGVAVSLPLSLLLSRLFGPKQYEGYWAYMESISRFDRQGIKRLWVYASFALLIFGGIVFFASAE